MKFPNNKWMDWRNSDKKQYFWKKDWNAFLYIFLHNVIKQFKEVAGILGHKDQEMQAGEKIPHHSGGNAWNRQFSCH